MLAMPDFDYVGTLMAISGMGLLFLLMSGMVATFFVINPRLRTPSPPPPFPAEKGEEPRISPLEEQDGGVE